MVAQRASGRQWCYSCSLRLPTWNGDRIVFAQMTKIRDLTFELIIAICGKHHLLFYTDCFHTNYFALLYERFTMAVTGCAMMGKLAVQKEKRKVKMAKRRKKKLSVK